MRILASLLALLAGCGCASMPAGHAESMRVEFAHGICSATAVGPQTVLIATHCLDMGGVPTNYAGRDGTILARTDDGKDHSLIRLNIGFDHWAPIGGDPVQGTQVHYYGNALGLHDLLRRGYVAGWNDGGWLLDIEGAPGDSGAAVFDDAGRVVGVISQMMQATGVNFRMMVIFPLAFTQKQLENVV